MDTICDDKDVILVVDDEEMVEEMIEAIVEDHGCAHTSFNDPVKALEHYRKNAGTITLMITDLAMPVLSGPDLIRKALEINPGLPVILVTGYLGEEVPDDIPPLVRGIVPKPFTKAGILGAVRTALGKSNS